MRVAHILRRYSPACWGGTESAVLALVRGLREIGIESDIWAPHEDFEASHDPFADAGIDILRYRGILPLVGVDQNTRTSLTSLGGNILSLDLLPRLLKKRYGAIHSHALGRIGGIGRRAAQLSSSPFFATVHGGYLDLPSEVRDRFSSAHKKGLDLGKAFGLVAGARNVIPNSDAVFTVNAKELGLMQKKFPHLDVRQIDNPVQFSEPGSLDETLRGKRFALMVSRIAPTKRQHIALRIFAALKLAGTLDSLVFAGGATDPEYAATVEKEANALGTEIAESIIFAGQLNPGSAELASLYANATITLLPSSAETFGIVLIESLGHGTPALATATSGANEIAARHDGCSTFRIDDVAAGVELGKRMLSDEELTSKIQQQKESLRARYSERAVASTIAHAYFEYGLR